MINPLFALFLWPVVVIVLFKRLDTRSALIWSLVGGYLFLPTKTFFDLPILPALTKDTAPSVTALIMCTIALSRASSRTGEQSLAALPGWLPRSRIILVLCLAMVLGAGASNFFNSDTLVYGRVVLPGLGAYDAASLSLEKGMSLLPFLLARRFLARSEDHRLLMTIFCVSAVAYSFLALYEVRMSPQLNRMVYGFYPSSWLQAIRSGGFRPLVFLDHGLRLGIFFTCAVIAAAVLFRTTTAPRTKRKYLFILVWLFGTLTLCKTVGALSIAIALLPVVFFKPRAQVLIAATIAGVVLVYPTLRGADLIPTERILSFYSSSTDRAASLKFRFLNEDILLGKARERPLLGWGGSGRSRVYDEYGNDISVTDGGWVIIIGVYGWLGYLALFGLLSAPTILLALRTRQVDPATAGLSLLLAANLVDLLPNSSFTPLTWMVAGALAGRLELQRDRAGIKAAPPVEADSAPSPGPAPRPRPVGPAYSRQTEVRTRIKRNIS